MDVAMKDDQRIALTKRLLREGLLRLLSKTDLNKISVTQLCIESGINRATFYRHYEEPRDILNDIKFEIFQEVAAFAEKAASKGDTRKWLELACRYFYEHSDILKILFRYRTDDDFVLFLNERFNEQYPNLINKGYFTDVDDDTMRLGTFYYAGGIYYILRQWITEPINKTPQEVAVLMYHFLNVDSFEMKVQGLDRTLVDKVFAICDYYMQDRVKKHSRHIYDIYKLLPVIPQNEEFKNLIKNVRSVRAMTNICLSAQLEVNVPELLNFLIENKVYRDDYEKVIARILEEDVNYETAIKAVKEIAASGLFE